MKARSTGHASFAALEPERTPGHQTALGEGKRPLRPDRTHVTPLPRRGQRTRRHAHDEERSQREDPARRETPSLPPEDERDGGGQRAGDALAEHGADEAEERRRVDPAPAARLRVLREAPAQEAEQREQVE